MKHGIFVVDDDRHYARLISYRLEKNTAFEVHVFGSGEEALRNLALGPDLVLLDIMMPGIGGIETLRRIKQEQPEIPVVMVSAQGVIDTAVEAMKLGAYDYVTKGQDDLVKLDTVVQHVLEKTRLEREVERLRDEVTQRYNVAGLIGESNAMHRAYRLVEKALRGDLTVAISGESGTGKELVARAIHFSGPRQRGPFVVVNCAAIPRDLMESEFFGHEKGSFTGAVSRKIGKFEQADGGTIFLDEIGELDLDLQAKLLRALQSREIQRVGGNETVRFDARVISATNRDVLTMIREGRFREDLYYRLFQFPIPLPPLRERGDDVLLLAESFLRDYKSTHAEFKNKRLSTRARRVILEYPWPGNVRELKSAIERAVLLSDFDEIWPDDLMLNAPVPISPWASRLSPAEGGELQVPRPGPAPSRPAAPPPSSAAARPPAQPPTPPLRSAPPDEDDEEGSLPPPSNSQRRGDIVSLDTLKQQAIEQAYRLCDGNVDRAAVELGIGRATLYRLLKKYGLMQ